MKVAIGIAVVAAVALGVWWFVGKDTSSLTVSTDTTATSTPSDTTGGATTTDTGSGVGVDVGVGVGSGAAMSATVSYNGSAFSPANVTIKKGGTVTWSTTNGATMWVASDNHPTHTLYAGTSLQQHCGSGSTDAFDQCSAGTSYSFTFTKVGTWEYHDHRNSGHEGTVTVVE